MKANYKIHVYNHSIFLTESQRYDLYACIPVEAVGILVMADIGKNFKAKSIKEIFVKYQLDCDINKNPVEIGKKKINIHVPTTGSSVLLYSEDDSFEINNDTPDIYDILNNDEGGRECLFYETFIHDTLKKYKSYHKIEIKDEKQFDDSIEFVDFSSSLKS